MDKRQDIGSLIDDLKNRSLFFGKGKRRRAAQLLGEYDQKEVVRPLADALNDPDLIVRQNALNSLAGMKSKDAVNEVCRIATYENREDLMKMAMKSGFRPNDLHIAALFYFLTGMWERYKEADPDMGMLSGVYQQADDALRERIHKAIDRSRNPGYQKIYTDEFRDGLWHKKESQPDDILSRRIKTCLAQRSWQELFALLKVAVYPFMFNIIKEIERSGWRPSDEYGLKTLSGIHERIDKARKAAGGELAWMVEAGLPLWHANIWKFFEGPEYDIPSVNEINALLAGPDPATIAEGLFCLSKRDPKGFQKEFLKHFPSPHWLISSLCHQLPNMHGDRIMDFDRITGIEGPVAPIFAQKLIFMIPVHGPQYKDHHKKVRDYINGLAALGAREKKTANAMLDVTDYQISRHIEDFDLAEFAPDLVFEMTDFDIASG